MLTINSKNFEKRTNMDDGSSYSSSTCYNVSECLPMLMDIQSFISGISDNTLRGIEFFPDGEDIIITARTHKLLAFQEYAPDSEVKDMASKISDLTIENAFGSFIIEMRFSG